MNNPFGTDFFGKQETVSRHDICGGCRKLTVLGSYTTGRFLQFRNFPLFPLGRVHVVDECPICGKRGLTSHRRFRKQRSRELAVMMEGFNKDPDNPDTALRGLQTLMTYNEARWFMDLKDSYGRRFHDHMQVHLVIAQGLCRFGEYAEAEAACKKALALGAGRRADELLTLCQSLRKSASDANFNELAVQPESMLRPYTFLISCMVLLLIGLCINGIVAMNHHDAWLVNGSPKPYTVVIDGKEYELPPYETKRIKLTLGKHVMESRGLPGQAMPVSFRYTTALLKQKFCNHALVLNPDTMAILGIETLQGGQRITQFRLGKSVNALDGIHHPFSDFSFWSRRGSRTRLFLHKTATQIESVETARTFISKDAAGLLARRILMIAPESAEATELLKVVEASLPAENAAAFLRKGRNDDAPLIDWHLFYQNFIERKIPTHDLQNEYALLCEKYSAEPLYYYLLGRIVRNRDHARPLFEKSEKDKGSGGLGYYAIARDLLCAGKFSDALPFAKKALMRNPSSPDFAELNQRIHLALRQYDPILQRIQGKLHSDPDNPALTARQIKYLTLAGEHAGAIEAAANFPNAVECWSAYFNAARYYAVGNVRDYLESMVDSGMQTNSVQFLLHAGKIDKAQQQEQADDGTAHLILYCAAQYHDLPEIAEAELKKALECDPYLLAAGDIPPSIQKVLELRMMPNQKAILCTALGFRFPKYQEAYFHLAQTFNHTPEYPQLLLKKWMQGAQHPSPQRAQRNHIEPRITRIYTDRNDLHPEL